MLFSELPTVPERLIVAKVPAAKAVDPVAVIVVPADVKKLPGVNVPLFQSRTISLVTVSAVPVRSMIAYRSVVDADIRTRADN